jgi:hypothetical protein
MINVCEIPDCEARVLARGLCSLHYSRLQRHGDPTFTKRPGRKRKPIVPVADRCSVDDCPERRVTRGWCQKHYQRVRRHGDVNAVHDAGRPVTLLLTDGRAQDLCRVDDCVNLVRRQGLCYKHLAEFKLCRYEGCTRNHLSHDPYCLIHHEGSVCITFGCENQEYLQGQCRRHYRQSIQDDRARELDILLRRG